MADPTNEPQKMEPVAEEEGYKIPTRAEHKRLIRRLWKWCLILAVLVFLGTASTLVTLWTLGFSPSEVLDYSTTSFQVLVLSYGMGFFIPILVTSVLMVALGIEMNRQALVIGSRSADVLAKVDSNIDKRMVRADTLMDKFEKQMDDAEKGKHPLADRFEASFQKEMKKLRAEIRNKGTETDEELTEALEEGEREAAEIECPACAVSPDGRLCPEHTTFGQGEPS